MCTQKTQLLLILIQSTQRKMHTSKDTVASFLLFTLYTVVKITKGCDAMYVKGV